MQIMVQTIFSIECNIINRQVVVIENDLFRLLRRSFVALIDSPSIGTSVLQTRSFEQRFAENVVVERVGRTDTCGSQFLWVVVDAVIVLGYGNPHTGVKAAVIHPEAVDLDAVGTLHILNIPIAVRQNKPAMTRRDVAKAQDDVTILASPHDELRLEQRDRVAASCRDQFTVHEFPLR